ncbi:hypothetical protein GCM10028895_37280 [Pontibacter rugosus]
MFEGRDKVNQFLNNNACDAAIEAANTARREGELWLEWRQEDGLQELYGISGIIELQYYAYTCKGRATYDAEDYQQALLAFKEADAVLDDLIGADSSWHVRKVWSWKSIADCHAKLLAYEKADSLYSLAISKYAAGVGKADEDMADLVISATTSASAQGAMQEANQMLEPLLVSFESKYKAGKGSYKGTMKLYEHLIANLLRANDYKKAALYLQKGKQFTHKDSLSYHVLQHYDGYLQLYTNKYKAAVLRLEEAKAGYKNLEQPGSGNHVVVRQALFKAYMALADYSKAEDLIKEAQKLSKRINGSESVLYHNVLLDAAQLDDHLGKYEAAKEKLVKVLQRYERQWRDNNRTAEILAQLATIEDELDNQTQAAAHANRAYAVIKWFTGYKSASDDEVLLNIANVNMSLKNYAFSDSLYRAVLARSEGDSYKTKKAKVLSGIALIEMEQGQFQKAGEKLEQAITTARQVVGEAHPMLATLYYNKSRLKLSEGKTEEALKEAAKARGIANKYFAANHVNQGDIYTLLGDIMLAQSKADEAEQLYLEAAKIYKLTYKVNHRKRQRIEEMLKSINATTAKQV